MSYWVVRFGRDGRPRGILMRDTLTKAVTAMEFMIKLNAERPRPHRNARYVVTSLSPLSGNLRRGREGGIFHEWNEDVLAYLAKDLA